jgi:hypothetical protein
MVEKEEGEGPLEGQWYAPDAGALTFHPSNAVCPFCAGRMEAIEVDTVFGRIVKDEEKRQGAKTSVIVELMPSTHQAFGCLRCETVFSILKEIEA